MTLLLGHGVRRRADCNLADGGRQSIGGHRARFERDLATPLGDPLPGLGEVFFVTEIAFQAHRLENP